MGILARTVISGYKISANLAISPGCKLRIFVRQALWLLAVLSCLSLALVDARILRMPWSSSIVQPLWSLKPVLGYFALTASLIDPMQEQVDLSDAQLKVVQRVALLEVEQLRGLEQASLVYILDPSLSPEQKRARIVEMGYNQRVLAISRASQQYLWLVLPGKTYTRFANWMQARWEIERALHGAASYASGPRSFEIYATRYDSKGAYYVALPDQCVKFTNGGNRICEGDGYVVGQKYDVYVSYKKGVGARVGESGPWNVDDNYWASFGDPTPRRMFADLPLGIPEAQAAFFNGYNGGVDQYGRKVTAPYGIDLARQVSVDIGLEPGTNDWIQVTFLWTEGWGNKSAAPAQGFPEANAPSTAAATVVTEQADGSLVWVVQANQTLWEIAAVNNLTLQELLEFNNLTEDSLIRVGDKLIVRNVDPDMSLTQTASSNPPTDTPRPTRTTLVRETPTDQPISEENQAGLTQEQAGQSETPDPSGLLSAANPVPVIIVLVVAAGILLMLVGVLMSRLGK